MIVRLVDLNRCSLHCAGFEAIRTGRKGVADGIISGVVLGVCLEGRDQCQRQEWY